MKTPIQLTLYDENGEEIKTYSRTHVSWEFFKRATNNRIPEDGILSDDDMSLIYKFVCDFYDNQFTVKELENGADVRETLSVVAQASRLVAEIMQEQGIKFPNVQTAAK
jgi:hypothetical protein